MDFNEECQCGKDLKKRIEQALDIKDSAQRKLRQIEIKLTDLRKQESELIRTIDELKSNATHEKTNFETLSMKIEQAKFALTELAERNTSELKPPLRLKALPKANFIGQDNTKSVPDCTFGSCFDLSRCSLSSGYPVLVRCPEDQNPTNWAIQNLAHPVDQLGCKISYDLQLPYSWKKLVNVRVGGCSRNTTRIALYRIKIDQLMHRISPPNQTKTPSAAARAFRPAPFAAVQASNLMPMSSSRGLCDVELVTPTGHTLRSLRALNCWYTQHPEYPKDLDLNNFHVETIKLL